MGVEATITTLRTDTLMVDHGVQRGLNVARAEAMAKDFKEEGLGVLAVSHRADGSYHIVDGQHRWEACKRAGKKFVQCKVYSGLSKQDEAALFRVLNQTKIVNALDRFRVKVVEGEPTAVDINGIIEKVGWRVPIQTTPKTQGVIHSPVALEWVYNGAGIRDRSQPGIFRQTIEILTAAWGFEPDVMRSDLVKGLGAFLTRYEGMLDLSKVVRMLQTYPGGPVKLFAEAKVMRSMRSSSCADSVAAILTGLYNKKKSVHKLPDWYADVWTRRRDASQDSAEE